jgi:diguanylate cyclase (GGDEF)-like protein
LCYGELLARLRSAARLLEYDRRASQQELLDAMTGLPSQSTLIAQVRRRWLTASGQKSAIACVLIDLDFFAGTRNVEGHGDTRMLLAAVTEELHKAEGADILACLGDDRFAAILPDTDIDAAGQWAERIRVAIAEKTFANKPNCRITASCGVACSQTAESVEELLDQATAALHSAKASGRNCVVRWGECADDQVASQPWDNFFGRTVAADVLTVCTVFLQEDESLQRAQALFQQTRLEAIPVVDAAGKLIGLCTEDHLDENSAEGKQSGLVRDVMVPSPRHFGPREDLSTLIKFFDAEPLAWAVIADNDRPLGLLTCDGLLGLSRPAGPLAGSKKSSFTDSTEYSLVPDFAVEEPAESA